MGKSYANTLHFYNNLMLNGINDIVNKNCIIHFDIESSNTRKNNGSNWFNLYFFIEIKTEVEIYFISNLKYFDNSNIFDLK